MFLWVLLRYSLVERRLSSVLPQPLLSNGREDAMDEPGSDFRRELEARGVSRREFMGFCSAMAVMFGLPKGATAMIA
ncbi:MAG: twin-arginine translocation signal domain-containing protein, partial [Deltaproteobacteria bacterium]|nr:twin-arginine translocation signal domain-containing protein [Deltaproteobacteria bacterium]MBW2720227.1 twin-arginine translocation signal domain-containing protein [Deltaproteobacteria bacterium]